MSECLYLPWTATAATPVLSISLTNSRVSSSCQAFRHSESETISVCATKLSAHRRQYPYLARHRLGHALNKCCQYLRRQRNKQTYMYVISLSLRDAYCLHPSFIPKSSLTAFFAAVEKSVAVKKAAREGLGTRIMAHLFYFLWLFQQCGSHPSL